MSTTFATFEAEVNAAEAARQVGIKTAANDAAIRAAEKTYRAAMAVAYRNWNRTGAGQAVRDHQEDIGSATGGGGWKAGD